MSSSVGISIPNSSQPSDSVPPASESSKDKKVEGKLKVIVQIDGSVVGEHAAHWKTRTGDFVRAHIPINYTSFKRVPQNFKDDVWNALMGEFELDVPMDLARPIIQRTWSQAFRTFKWSLRQILKNDDLVNVEPKGINPHIWKMFQENESDPKKQNQNLKNAANRKMLEFSHCLGRCSYAQKEYKMEKKNPRKVFGREDKWLDAHEHKDGTVLEKAKGKYEEVKAAKNKRKAKSPAGEGCSGTCEDLDSDVLSEVFGKQTKGGVRAMGSHVTKKQLIHMGVAKSKLEQCKNTTNEAQSLKNEIFSHVDTRLDNFEGILLSAISKLTTLISPPIVSTPPSTGSNSVQRPSHTSQNLDSVFGTVGISRCHMPSSIDVPPANTTLIDKPSVILNDKFVKVLAKRYVVTDATSKTFHFKKVGNGERKVYVEEVIEPDAPLWDPPQEGYETLAGFVEGGFVIWLDCWLTYV